MGFFIALIVFVATALTANHMGHLQEHNQVLTQKVQVPTWFMRQKILPVF